MKLLIIGGAGKVGRIINNTLAAEHTCRHFDRVPVPGYENETIIADVHDNDAIREAMTGVDSVLYMALGIRPGEPKSIYEPDVAFGVNTVAFYKLMSVAVELKIRHIVYASTMSIFGHRGEWDDVIHDQTPPKSWDAYGFSKRMGEEICKTTAERMPEATILAPRLMWPCTDDEWAERQARLAAPDAKPDPAWRPLGPVDTRSFFQKLLACNTPGAHFMITTGDVEEQRYRHDVAKQLLNWQPQGR